MPTASRTYTFLSNAEGFADAGDTANITMARSAIDGNPAGSLEWTGSTPGATPEFARDSLESWIAKFGLPAGAAVTQVQVTSWDEIAWGGGSQTRQVRFRIVDSANVSVHSAGELFDTGSGSPSNVTGTPQPKGAGTARAVDSKSAHSEKLIKFEIQVNMSGSGAYDLEQDNIAVTVTYFVPDVATSNPTNAFSQAPGDVPWDTPEGIELEGEPFDAATCSIPGGDTEWLYGDHFGFAIPSDATITGIEFIMNVVNNALGHFHENAAHVLKGGALSATSIANATEWPATPPTPEDRIRGGPTELWGETWTPADINDPSFGAAFQGNEIGGIETSIATVEYYRINVYSTGGTYVSGAPVKPDWSKFPRFLLRRST